MAKYLEEIYYNRKNWTFRFARMVNVWGYKHLGKSHFEMPAGLKELRSEKTVFLYTGLHKSLWETTGILVTLYLNKMPLPYTGMGDNLVRGKFFQRLAKNTGIFLVKRATNPREMLESAKKLKNFIISFLAHGLDVIIFPEGTRKSVLSTGEYGKFFATAFEALLEYEKDKVEILETYPELKHYDSYIIPMNVDYSRIREDWEMIHTFQGNPRTLHVLDSLKMFKKVGHTYVSFGEPIKMADHKSMHRKDLAVLIRNKCLDLVKILPINIVSKAIMDSVDEEKECINIEAIEGNIAANMQKMDHLKDRFRGFTSEDAPAVLLKHVADYVPCYRNGHIDFKNRSFYKLYADFIGHYYK